MKSVWHFPAYILLQAFCSQYNLITTEVLLKYFLVLTMSRIELLGMKKITSTVIFLNKSKLYFCKIVRTS